MLFTGCCLCISWWSHEHRHRSTVFTLSGKSSFYCPLLQNLTTNHIQVAVSSVGRSEDREDLEQIKDGLDDVESLGLFLITSTMTNPFIFHAQCTIHSSVSHVVLFQTCIRYMILASWTFYVHSVVHLIGCPSMYRRQVLDILSLKCAAKEERLNFLVYQHLHNLSTICFLAMILKANSFAKTLSSTMWASLSPLWVLMLIILSVVKVLLSFGSMKNWHISLALYCQKLTNPLYMHSFTSVIHIRNTALAFRAMKIFVLKHCWLCRTCCGTAIHTIAFTNMSMKFSVNVRDLICLQNFVFSPEMIHIVIMNLLLMRSVSFCQEMNTKVTIKILLTSVLAWHNWWAEAVEAWENQWRSSFICSSSLCFAVSSWRTRVV